MKQDRLLNILLELGLAENDAKAYLAVLSLGPTTVIKAASLTGIKRSSLYPIIERLKNAGLMSEEVVGFKKLYRAETPEKLELIVEEKKAKFKSSLPDFMELYNLQGHHDVIKRYDGLQAVKSVYEDLIKKIRPHEDYMIIGDPEKWLKLDEDYFMNFSERRAKLPIKIRALLTDSPKARWYKQFEKNFNLKAKFLPSNVSLTTNTVIIPEMLAIHQITPPVSALVIENKSTIQTHQELFNLLWETLPDED